ncbi:MAG: lamin tail domain-containing protein [Myxococcota bacterium]
MRRRPSTCDAGGVVTCGQYDADACLDVSLPAACDAGQACSEGACSAVAQCQDECAADGDRRCDASGVGVEECGQHDADACREWARVADCDAGESCSLGRCVTGCADECTAGEHRCQPGSSTLVEVCKADADLDTCLEWAVASDCADQSEVCSGGACAAECADECPGFATCDGDAILPCGDFDDDPCLDLGAPAPCDPSEVCVAGDAAAACQPAPAPGHLKISEVLYNNPGDDTGTFIELAGEPGLPLAGFTLVAINGGTGLSYATLALGGSMPADGFYVIAHPQAGDAIAAAADVKDTFADLQNGPDNLQIVWGDTVVDALGYGNFGNDDEFRGEGEPAVDVPAGHALARIGDLQDTDDNRADFADVEVATPGTGYLAARTPSAFRDLAVTEVMADPKVLDDTQGEWFELYNPHADVTWDLAGCRIESSATESYLIDASLVVPPGGRVVLARSANPGFVPDRVYSSIKLANASDVLSLVCGGVHIDDFAWTVAAPTGKSISVDPSYEDADLNDDPDAWCPAPVTAAEGKDAATPGLANPPCPNVSGVYTRTALDSQWGSCDEAPDWQAFSFDAAPAASGDATLTFQWWSVFCPLYADSSDIWIEIADGDGGYTEIAHTTLNTVLQACSWRDGSSSVSAAVVSAARATSGRIEGRFRIEGGCPQGVGCGILGQTVPYNCARRLTLSYPY